MLCDANTARGLACGQTAFQGGSIGLGIFRRFLASFTLGEVLLLAVSLAFLAYLQVAARAVAPQPDRGLTPKTDTAPRPPDSRPPSASGVFTPTVYPASTSVSGPETPLTPAQRKSFEQDFRQGGYFGAFAVSGNGAWGWTVRHADAEAAAQAALAECVHHGRDCRVIATLAPEGGVVPDLPSLSFKQAGVLAQAQAATVAQAQVLAMATCNRGRRKLRHLPVFPCQPVDLSP